MKDIDQHFLLYAKYHYAHGDTMQDLRTIISREFSLPMDCIPEGDILEVLMNSTFRILQEQDLFTEHQIGNIIKESGPGRPKWLFTNESWNFYKAMCQSMLTELMKLVCFRDGETILDIGEPDPDILPLSEGKVSRSNLEEKNQDYVEAHSTHVECSK